MKIKFIYCPFCDEVDYKEAHKTGKICNGRYKKEIPGSVEELRCMELLCRVELDFEGVKN